jgi:hypothetical protein
MVFNTQFIEPGTVLVKNDGPLNQTNNNTGTMSVLIPEIDGVPFSHVTHVTALTFLGNDPYPGQSITSLAAIAGALEAETALAADDADAGELVNATVKIKAAGQVHTAYIYVTGS